MYRFAANVRQRHATRRKEVLFLRNPGQIPRIHYLVRRFKASVCKSRCDNQHGAPKNSQATPRVCRPGQFLLQPVEEACTFLNVANGFDNTEKGSVEWNEKAKQTFSNMKSICAQDALLHYLDFNKVFEIHTDSSKIQMGGVISQGQPQVAYWRRKLTPTKRKYPTIEQEILAIT